MIGNKPITKSHEQASNFCIKEKGSIAFDRCPAIFELLAAHLLKRKESYGTLEIEIQSRN